MKTDEPNSPAPLAYNSQPDRSSDVRIFASWLGLMLVAFGVAMAGYLFYRIGQTILDPRSFETQVDRWEFVVRGRTTDAFPDAFETPDRTVIGAQQKTMEQNPSADNRDQTEEMARLVGRVGSKSARPAALLLIILVLMLLVKIITSIIGAGIRLAGLAGGEREYMKRIVEELLHQRNRRG